jgi:hypothetical protein
MIALAFLIDSDNVYYRHIESNVKKQYLGEFPDYSQRLLYRDGNLYRAAPKVKEYLFVWC